MAACRIDSGVTCRLLCRPEDSLAAEGLQGRRRVFPLDDAQPGLGGRTLAGGASGARSAAEHLVDVGVDVGAINEGVGVAVGEAGRGRGLAEQGVDEVRHLRQRGIRSYLPDFGGLGLGLGTGILGGFPPAPMFRGFDPLPGVLPGFFVVFAIGLFHLHG